MEWCFNTPKAEPLSCLTSPIDKEKIKIVIISILNVLDILSYSNIMSQPTVLVQGQVIHQIIVNLAQ